jgi:glutathione S-transferase
LVRFMRSLLHNAFDPSSRFARLVLAEKGLPARLVETRTCDDEADFSRFNHAMTLPVLIEEPPTGGEISIAPASVIAEYLEEVYGGPALLPATSAGRVEARRLVLWFEGKFEAEVNALIIRGRINHRRDVRHWDKPEPLGKLNQAIGWHLDYLSYLLENRQWLAGEKLTIADLAAAAHLSVHDYFGLVPWMEFRDVRDWYARIKSRASMRPILSDRLEGVSAPAHYADPDF